MHRRTNNSNAWKGKDPLQSEYLKLSQGKNQNSRRTLDYLEWAVLKPDRCKKALNIAFP